jgi:mannosyltransferase OCH1-like enzyme
LFSDVRNLLEKDFKLLELNIMGPKEYQVQQSDSFWINKKLLTDNKYNKIPKKIFQTWENSDIEPEFQEIINKWKDNNPDFEYIFYDSTQREAFIKEYFDENVFIAYDKIGPGAFKCDLWRYCVLYIYGGFYVDIDVLCIGNLNDIIDTDIEFIVPIDLNLDGNRQREGQHNLACGFIGSVPNSPILIDAINRIVFNVESNIICASILDFSGPGLLGRAVNKYLKLEETESFVGKEGVQNKIKFLKFEQFTEYMSDINNNHIILQNKNGNSNIIKLYEYECKKLKNYVQWYA